MAQAVIAKNISVPRGMKTFLIIWMGQVISMIGSDLTGFQLGTWVYQNTGSVTMFSRAQKIARAWIGGLACE